MHFTPDAFRAWPTKRITLLGMSGVGKTHISAMLHGGLNGKAGTTAVFINRLGHIIASTDTSRPVGTPLDIDPVVLKQKNGHSSSTITVHDGRYASMGFTATNGYREFKVRDGYQEDVIAVVFESFGEVRERVPSGNKTATTLESSSAVCGGKQFATCFIDGNLYAIPAEQVLEALPGSNLLPMTMGGFEGRIGMLAYGHGNEEKKIIWVFDLGYMVRGRLTEITHGSQVIVVQHGDQSIGLLVDELHGVPEFSDELTTPTPFARHDGVTLIPQVIRANQGKVLIQVINLDYVYSTLKAGEMPCMPEPVMEEAA